jgi:hypothetical protein
LEWTDVRLIEDSVRKDEAIKKLLADLNENKFVIKDSFKASALDYLWKSRNITWIWPFTSKILGLPIDFDSDVPIETLKRNLFKRTKHRSNGQ